MSPLPFSPVAARQREERMRAIVEGNARDLLAYFARRVDVLEDAADLTSDTLLIAWRRIRDLPANDDEARMWLFGVARKTLYNHHRGRRRAESGTERLRLELLAAQDPTGESEHDSRAEIRDLVSRLPEGQRDVVSLVHWEGFSLAEAASILGIPASTARGRYATARTTLRESLAQQDLTPTPRDG